MLSMYHCTKKTRDLTGPSANTQHTEEGKVVCVGVCVGERAYHNLKSVITGASILFLFVSLTLFSFHLSLTHIALCNCTLIFQCQSGLCPQPYCLLQSRFSRFSTTFLISHIFHHTVCVTPPLNGLYCNCCMPLVDTCVCTRGRERACLCHLAPV